MDNIIKEGSFIAISDFDSNRWPLEEKIKYYLNEYEVIYILGNTSDIGNNDDRTLLKEKGDIHLLLEIMNLSKKMPDRIVYIPGKHYEILYNYAHKGSSLDKKMDEYLMYNWIKGKDTLKELDLLKTNYPQRYEELIEWLGKLPIQRKHSCNGQDYSLAHAFFNKSIYINNPNLSLEDLFKTSNNSYNSQNQILWFKNGDNYDVNDVPINSTIIVGNSPVKNQVVQNINLTNSNDKITEVFPINSGTSYQRKNNTMFNEKSTDATRIIQINDKQITNYSQTDFEIVVDAIKNTYKKHGFNQVRETIIDWIFSGRKDWYMPISRPDRFNIKNIDLDKVKAIIKSFSKADESDPIIIADNFLSSILSLKNNPEIINPNKNKEIVNSKNNYPTTPKENNIIEESLRILDIIATKEEQNYNVSYKGKQYTLRNYVIDILPRFYINNELKLKNNGKIISFQEYINNMLNEYRSKMSKNNNSEENLLERIRLLKEQRMHFFDSQSQDYKPKLK